MSARRFMIDSRCISGDTALLGEEAHRHMVRVLRLAEGAPVVLADETGRHYRGTIDTIAEGRVAVAIHSTEAPAPPAAGSAITLCQALPKGEKIDLILQKGTELGVREFRLFSGRRSVVRLKEEQLGGRLARWERIVTEAARQCGRPTPPAIRWFASAAEAASAAGHDLRLLLDESERTARLADALPPGALAGSVIVAVGPEGGFDRSEAEQFIAGGFRGVTLGRRIMRTETAAIAIVAILQYISGEI